MLWDLWSYFQWYSNFPRFSRIPYLHSISRPPLTRDHHPVWICHLPPLHISLWYSGSLKHCAKLSSECSVQCYWIPCTLGGIILRILSWSCLASWWPAQPLRTSFNDAFQHGFFSCFSSWHLKGSHISPFTEVECYVMAEVLCFPDS